MADKPMLKGPDIYIGGKPKAKPKMTDELRKREQRYSSNRMDRRAQRRSTKA